MKVSHFFISSALLVITLSSTLKIAGTLGYYAIFMDNFIENFCENKNRPELQCDGKCALSKMLLQEAQENREPINLDFLKIETVLFLDAIPKVEFSAPYTTTHFDVWYTNNYHFNLIDRIIHPPRL